MPTIFRTEDNLPFVENHQGELIVLGCLKPDPTFTAAPDFTTAFNVLPQSEWKENSLKAANVPIRDQKQFGSCGGQSSCESFMYARAIRGLKPVILSATFIYGLCNGGKDAGSRVTDCVNVLKTYGTCLDSQVPYNMIYRTQFPQAAFDTAQHYKALEVYKINTYEELITALVLGFPCVTGIAVGQNFVHNQLSPYGIAPLPNIVAGGHALCIMGIKYLENKWVLEFQNSWSKTWGLDGFAYLQKGNFNPGYGFGFDTYAICSVLADPKEDNEGLLVPVKE